MTTCDTRTEAEVAALWDISSSTLRRLRRENQLPAHKFENGEILYLVGTLNALMQSGAQGLHVPPPTVAMLEAGEDTLLTIKQVMARLDTPKGTLFHFFKKGDLGKISITGKGTVRVPAREVTYYERRTSPDAIVNTDEAAKLFCTSHGTMRDMLRNPDNKLEVVELRGLGGWNYVTRESVNALLKQRLEGLITLEEWYRWILHDNAETLTITVAHERYPISEFALRRHLAAGELTALLSGNDWHIPVPALKRLLHQRRRRTASQLAKLFSIDEHTAQWMLNARILCQRNHRRGYERCPDYWCVERFVAANSTAADRTAAAWLAQRHQDAEPLVTSAELMEIAWGVTSEVLEKAACDGVLDGIWLPRIVGSRYLAATQTSAREFIRQQDRAYSMYAEITRR